ncbi:MAG: energy transducer TonB [Candidatus Acidiferrales bacterium]
MEQPPTGTCVTELNGYYHCAQDRITSGGAHITLRQCTQQEITAPFPVCWSDQPAPARPPEDPRAAGLPAASWVSLGAKDLAHAVDQAQLLHGRPFFQAKDVVLDYCKPGYKCSVGPMQNTYVAGPSYFVVEQGASGGSQWAAKAVRLEQYAATQVVLEGNFKGTFGKYNGNDNYNPDQKAAIQAFCQRGLALFKSVNFSDGNSKLFSACDQSLGEKSRVNVGQDDPPHAGEKGYGTPVCLYCPQPGFSDEAIKAKHFDGVVVLEALVTADGRARNVRVIKAVGLGLDIKAVEIVPTWRFKPALGPDGRAASVVTRIECKFHLDPNVKGNPK